MSYYCTRSVHSWLRCHWVHVAVVGSYAVWCCSIYSSYCLSILDECQEKSTKLEQQDYTMCLIAKTPCEPDLHWHILLLSYWAIQKCALLSDGWWNRTKSLSGCGPEGSQGTHPVLSVDARPSWGLFPYTYPLINICKSVGLLLSSENRSTTLLCIKSVPNRPSQIMFSYVHVLYHRWECDQI